MNMSEHHTKPQLMAFAVQKAKESHQRWSETREQVFSALLDVEQPISAYDLAAKVAGMFSRQVNAMSVYRALDALCAMGLAVRVESLNAYLPCKHMEEDAHQHVVLVCDACGNADEIEDSGFQINWSVMPNRMDSKRRARFWNCMGRVVNARMSEPF